MPMLSWHIKSTSKAADGLYVYDTVQRLNDSRFGDRRRLRHPPLHQARPARARRSRRRDAPRAADRRDRQGRPRVPERPPARARRDALHGRRDRRRDRRQASGRSCSSPRTTRRSCPTRSCAAASSTTSSSPTSRLMRQIVAVHHPHLDAKLLDQVLIKFYWLREQSELRKKPSTSELVDWISALLRAGVTQDAARGAHPVPRRAAQEGAGRRRAGTLRRARRTLSRRAGPTSGPRYNQ